MATVMLNRMMLAIARRVRTFVWELGGEVPLEAHGVGNLPPGVDLLVVGRQHIQDGARRRFGHDVLDAAVARARPRVCLYVLPGILDPWTHRRDLEAIGRVRDATRIHVLEFSVLRELEPSQAVAVARDVLQGRVRTPVAGGVDLLLPRPVGDVGAPDLASVG